jgi:glycosyltransferase involved in cell wall biosynthesis
MVTARWWPSVGGIETHARQWARWLRARGVRVEVLCLDDDPLQSPFDVRVVDDDGVRVTRVAYRYHDHETFADLARNEHLEELGQAWARESQLDLIHIHHLTGWGHGLVKALAGHAPVVLTLHDYWTVCARGQLWNASNECCPGPSLERCTPCLSLTWPHLRVKGRDELGFADDTESVRSLLAAGPLAFDCAAALLAPSEPARRVLVEAGVPDERLSVFSLGVECESLALEVERLRADQPPRNELRLGVLGAVQPTKGVLELAQAVLECAVDGLVLMVHGPLGSFHGDSSYTDQLRALAKSHDSIRLCGSYDPAELPGVLASLDAVAAPAQWEEGFGLSVREAAAVGLPVLVSDAGGLPELVETDGAVGVIARRADPHSLQEALRWMNSTGSFGVVPPKERPRLTSVDEMAEELIDVYLGVLEAQSSQASSSADAEAPQE